MSLLDALRSSDHLVAAELRPPRAELAAPAGMDAWIDTYHAVRSLVRRGTHVFLTDSAVGLREEDNLRHLITNVGTDVARDRVIPFLTCKHALDYCLNYGDKAWQHGFPALVVLGGDQSVGAPRCVPHAWELRRRIRDRRPELTLGGWANPHADPTTQVDFLLSNEANAEFFLTQIVSHHDAAKVERFLDEARRRGLSLPGVFGVFYYRSANPRTLERLRAFLPVPAEGLTREFADGLAPEQVCARTLTGLAAVGARHFYISNLPIDTATITLAKIKALAGM
jgi:5,10-methylenetetrahydrofolate reductase